MANPLYFTGCYIKEFHAKVLENPTPMSVTLDKTAFYPCGGGQPSDQGEMIAADGQRFKVINVIKQEGKIIHELDSQAPGPGQEVHCMIDWPRRYIHMRMHSAAHLICAIIHSKTGAKITGNQIGAERTRIDFNLEQFDKAQIQNAVDEANEIIKKGSGIALAVLTPEQAASIPGLVKLEEDRLSGHTEIRTVSIGDIDTQACGGTHVKDAKEIGAITLERVENKGKNNRRIYFTLA